MNILQSIFKYKCPRCRQGDIFVKPFSISKPLEMPERCSVCNLKTEPEPGYYFGAMFISYIWTGFLFLAIIALCTLVFGWSVNQSFVLLIIVAALMYFWIARVSRSIFFHLDIRYDPSKIKNPKNENGD
jgi:uncharacterized protein (DUF983 family)